MAAAFALALAGYRDYHARWEEALGAPNCRLLNDQLIQKPRWVCLQWHGTPID